MFPLLALMLIQEPAVVTVDEVSRLLDAGQALAAAQGAARLATDPATPIDDRRFAVSVASGAWRDEYKRTGDVLYLCRARGVLVDYLARPAPPQAQVLARRLSQIDTQLRQHPRACGAPPRPGRGLRLAGGLMLGGGAAVALTGLGVGLARMLASANAAAQLTDDAKMAARPFDDAELRQLAGNRRDFDAARLTVLTTTIVGGAVVVGGVVASVMGARRGRRVPGVWASARTWGITWTVQF